MDFEGEIDIFGCTVAHQFEFAVGWDEGYDSVGVETSQFHALVKLAVFQRDAAGRGFCCFCARGVSRRGGGEAVAVEKEAVVEAEFTFW